MKVLLGVCGGIAAYKAAELTRELQRRGVEVQVVMTSGAERFVTPLTFAALSGHTVLTSLWEPTNPETSSGLKAHPDAHFDIEHIRIAQQIDALVIAPATANVIARLAHGMADDLLSTIFLATTRPVLLAPAMNVNMWWNPATQDNLALLRKRGVAVIMPAAGELACGMVGDGRLAEPAVIADAVLALQGAGASREPEQGTRDLPQNSPTHPSRNDLAGHTVLITAGGTREPIDPVRYLGNRSSGRMGLALAEASLARGAQVILITTVDSALPCETIRVATAAEMQQAVLTALSRASIVIMAAAVSDYRLAQPAPHKLKKKPALTLELTQNDDILKHIVAQRRPQTLVIGFAAETEHVVAEGRRKLREKGVDAILANDVSRPDSGLEVDRNAGLLLTASHEVALPSASKRELADCLLDHLPAIRTDRPGAAPV